jgi:hypothetical protein
VFRKCSGHRPVCQRCAHHHITCRFAGEPGETPSRILKRNVRSLRDSTATHDKIIDLLTKLPEPQAQDVLQRIRAGVPLETICNQVTAGDAMVQLAVAPESRFRYTLLYQTEMPAAFTRNNPYVETLLYESTSLFHSNSPGATLGTASFGMPSGSSVESRLSGVVHKTPYLMPFHAAMLIEPLLSDAKPSQWTMVCKDDMLLRDLLRVWLRCEYSFTSAFQKDHFLQDMVSSENDFCSELLVNAVLAYCCVSLPPLIADYSLAGSIVSLMPTSDLTDMLPNILRSCAVLEPSEPCLPFSRGGKAPLGTRGYRAAANHYTRWCDTECLSQLVWTR